MFILPLIAGLAAGQALAKPFARSAASYPIVKTTTGGVRGTVSEYRDNVTVYKGIPFASPPTGSLRWKAPVAAQPWTDVLNATTFGDACAQGSMGSASIFTSTIASSENCLTLNVWTPTYNDADLTSKNLPVFVWIFGGRFEIGSGDVMTYDGSGLAIKDIIVVTLNYRLGPFGFLAHPELNEESGHNASGNYGLMDQQFALKWVQDNIANFGGNPNQVTVGGQSAGSSSALSMMWSPLSRDLIHGVVAESGARGPRDPMTGSAATSWRSKAAAEADGVDFISNSLKVSSIAAARNLSTDAFSNYENESDTTFADTVYANVSAFMDPPLWRPVIDGYVLPHTYSEALRLNDHADVPIMTGNNKDESGASPTNDYTATAYNTTYSTMFGSNFSSQFFELYPGTNETEASENSNEFYRDLSRVGTWRWSVDWAAGGAKSDVFTYYFTTAPAENRASGAYHGSELWYTFNNIPYVDYSNVTWNAHDYAVEKAMSEYWANFIKTGNPNGGNLTYFPPSTDASAQTMWLGDSYGSSFISKSAERIKFLESWFSTLPEW